MYAVIVLAQTTPAAAAISWKSSVRLPLHVPDMAACGVGAFEHVADEVLGRRRSRQRESTKHLDAGVETRREQAAEGEAVEPDASAIDERLARDPFRHALCVREFA